MEIITKNAEETKDLGRKIATKLKGGEVVLLSGDLGSGKTTFTQGLAEGLGVNQRILSPTFILMRQYAINLGGNLYHLDLYRLEGDLRNDFETLGLKDRWGEENSVMVVEWAEKAQGLLPKGISINFKNIDEERRGVEIEGLEI